MTDSLTKLHEDKDNVLMEIDRAIELLRGPGWSWEKYTADHLAKLRPKIAEAFDSHMAVARATIAELVEAAQFVLDKEWEYGEDQPACARLNAALAAFRGEQA